MIEKKKLALIHIVKKELKLDDKEYRNILRTATGVQSAKELNDAQFKKLMNYFVRSKHYRLNAYGLTLKQKLFIQYLAETMGWDQSHLSNFIHKYYHKHNINQLTRKDAIKVIESLKKVKVHQPAELKGEKS
jgi:phage gp16-like protein